MTAAIERELLAKLDFSAAWTGTRGQPDLLPDRPSGTHPLASMALYFTVERGDAKPIPPTQTPEQGRDTFRSMAGAERAQCEARKAGRPPGPVGGAATKAKLASRERSTRRFWQSRAAANSTAQVFA
jgi:hypothetical protein